LNPHASRHKNLNLARLPISPHPRAKKVKGGAFKSNFSLFQSKYQLLCKVSGRNYLFLPEIKGFLFKKSLLKQGEQFIKLLPLLLERGLMLWN
jgi:hypothetical protein